MKYLVKAVIPVILASTACNVLEEEIVTKITADTYYKTPEGFEDAVNAAYASLRNFYGDENGCGITVFGTDEYTHSSYGTAQSVNRYDAGLNAESGLFSEIWRELYRGINICNTITARAPGVDIPEDMKASSVGEARFLRAHHYYLLVEFWGPVHLTFEETIGLETEASRTPESVIYDSIIADLQYAVGNLPDVPGRFGRATSWAARHQLALVYLTRAYKSFARPDDFDKAADLAMDVIENSSHELLEDYQEIYNIADEYGHLYHTNEKNKEIIFSVQYDIDPILNSPGNGTHLFFRPFYERYNRGLQRALGHGYGLPWMRFRPTPWLLENFRPLDVDSRFEKSFQVVWYYNKPSGIPSGASPGDTAIWITDKELSSTDLDTIKARLPGVNLLSWNLNNTDEDWSLWRSDVSATNPNISIWPSPWKMDDNLRSSVSDTRGSRDFILFRLGETYLIAAEAMLGRDGDASNAVDYINTIRRRAAYPGRESEMEVNPSEIDIDFILDEWSRECFGEQSRWLDLKRTGKLLERTMLYNPDAASNIKEYHILRPIPADQISLTTNDFGQNDGY